MADINLQDPRTCPTGHRPEDQPAGHQEHALQAAQVPVLLPRILLPRTTKFLAILNRLIYRTTASKNNKEQGMIYWASDLMIH
jgi:hypothetical protein